MRRLICAFVVHIGQKQVFSCVPSEGLDHPGHPPSLIRVFTVRMKEAWVLSYPLSAQQRLWSDWADAQADLSLRRALSHFVGFVMSRLICKSTFSKFCSLLFLLIICFGLNNSLTNFVHFNSFFCFHDRFSEKGDKNFKRRAYQRILNINRCIVIDMPEIQIPWFMGQYVEEWRHANSDSNPVSKCIRAPSRENLSPEVVDQIRLKPAC